MHTTSATLLEDLKRAGDSRAWTRLVHLYSPLIFSWAGRMGLQHADALDLVQDVFSALVQELPRFSYDRERGFRNWLFIVTRNKYLAKARRRALPVDGRMSPEELATPPEETIEEADFQRHVLGQILPSMRQLFQASTWQAFWDHVVKGEPAPEVAARLGITVSAIFKAKARVLARLHRELADLMPEHLN